ncbi:hypothetical protein SAMN05444392_103189 [Seinonella peptonophila]|uniref:Uncharacterized protein n=1 Tax=Seinonella peptonophila TaxID=112248 RepID=A0A1M4WEW5_9BACL|nr:hypothetical protein SAMN05444392_103189 [Seinonella peptonophila]
MNWDTITFSEALLFINNSIKIIVYLAIPIFISLTIAFTISKHETTRKKLNISLWLVAIITLISIICNLSINIYL